MISTMLNPDDALYNADSRRYRFIDDTGAYLDAGIAAVGVITSAVKGSVRNAADTGIEAEGRTGK